MDTPPEDAINVVTIMEEIKRKARERQRDPQVQESLKQISAINIAPELPLLANEEELEENASLFNKYVVPSSSRKGLRKKVTDLIHKKIFLSVNLILQNIISSQEKFNFAIIESLKELWLDLAHIEKESKASIAKNEELEKNIRNLLGTVSSDKGSVLDKVLAIEKRDRYDNFPYLAFEEKYRGDESRIKENQMKYVQYFKGKEAVVDLGCGRGEFLQLLKENGIDAKGVDSNHHMIAHAREKNLHVVEEDALHYLQGLADNSVGGIFAAQFIEHIPYYFLVELLQEAFKKLQDGSYIVLETINPESLFVFTSSLYLDPSHTKPIHPKTMSFLLEQCGFHDVQIVYASPKEEKDRLQHISVQSEWSDIYNANIDKLNNLLLGPQDYAVIGKK